MRGLTRSGLVAALVLMACALLPVGAGAAGPVCRSAGVRATFSMVPGSQGAGQVGYLLTLTNTGHARCAIDGLPAMRLLGSRGVELPTAGRPSGGGAVVLAPGQWAQSTASFTPDIAGRGEPGAHCEAVAQSLRLTLHGGAGTLVAPMDPTMVCQHGAMAFSGLRAIAPLPACRAGSLHASFDAIGRPYDGQVMYALLLRNDGSRGCVVVGTPGLALSHAPTTLTVPVPYPYVIGARRQATLDATGVTRPGPGEPTRGACEPVAAHLEITLPVGGGTLSAAIEPARSFCHDGELAVSGLFLNG
jgi:hypothetical protein